MTTSTHAREYTSDSMDVAGALKYIRARMAHTTGPIELQRAMANDEVTVLLNEGAQQEITP